MINVNQATKTAYLSDSIPKQLTVSFPALEIELGNEDIDSQNLDITERVVADKSIEFVGCLASVLHITFRTLTEDVTGQKIVVSMLPTYTGAETIVLFTGYVDKVEQVPHQTIKKITAYDMLYTLKDTNIADWYNNLTFPQTIKSFRDSLFTALGITQITADLVNDSVSFERDYNPTELAALDVIKSICQINCVFGRMTRDEKFEYVEVPTTISTDQALTKYKKADYQEYMVNPVDKLVIRVKGKDYESGTGNNKYIIQNNFFLNNLSEELLRTIAERLLPLVEDFTYQPFDADVNGLPYIECVDVISIPVKNLSTDIPVITPFVVLERTMRGIQAIRDNFSAEGDEYQREFVTDVSVEIEELKKIVEVMQNDLDNLAFRYYLITNTSDIEIGDGETKSIFNDDLRFTATKNTVVVFQAEILLEVETTVDDDDYYDAEAVFEYTFNSAPITDYTPTEIWTDGNHVMHLLKYFEIRNSGTENILDVTLTMTGGSASISSANMRGGLYGQNLVASDEWNGYIRIRETPSLWNMVDITFNAATDTESVVVE